MSTFICILLPSSVSTRKCVNFKWRTVSFPPLKPEIEIISYSVVFNEHRSPRRINYSTFYPTFPAQSEQSYYISTMILPNNYLISLNNGMFNWQHICYAWWTCFQHTVVIPMGTNCILLLDNCSFINMRFHRWASQETRIKSYPDLFFTFRYIDDVFSLNSFSYFIAIDDI
jgi:hypothetical protein